MTTITALPDPPTRDDPTNFKTRADALMSALPDFVTETNTVAGEVLAHATTAGNAADTATTQAGLATSNGAAQVALASAQAVAAAASAASAQAVANVIQWISGTTYAQGDCVWSPTTLLTYRRKVAGAGSTDPSADPTNWARVDGQPIDAAVTTTGTSALNTVELCAASAAINRTIPAGAVVGDSVGYKDNGQMFATYSLTVTPPSGHRIEDFAVNETLTVTSNYRAFTLKQVSAGLWRIF
jgi:hypothetical protein